MEIKRVVRKSMLIRESGRSTDFLTPTFIMGCAYNCFYCYCKRHKTEGWSIATNIGDILTEVNSHAYFTTVDKPNQTHSEFTTYDIGCNSDVSLHAKDLNLFAIFEFFRDHPIAMGSFATKYVNKSLLEFNPKGKIRIRFSLMPQKYADLLEPNTSKIMDRIKAINVFIKAGYDVHINFSPVIVTNNWLEEYKQLFMLVNSNVDEENKSLVKAEVIFLTHNRNKHLHNLANGTPGEELLWNPDIQESKTSQYGGENIRYNHVLKSNYIKQFTALHKQTIDWCTIRYIF